MAQIMAKKCDFFCNEEATLYCKVCNQFLCIECRKKVHDKFPKFKDHAVVNIHQEGNCVFRPHPVCEIHKDTFVFYCCKCECLTCAECMTSTHNEHKTEKIKNVADARRQNVNQIVEQLKTKVETVKEKLETINTIHSIQIQSDCESYVKTVEKTVSDLHTLINKHKTIPLTTASDFKIIENEDLGRKKAFFKNRQDDVVDRLLKFEDLLLQTHDSTFLTEWKTLQKDVKINDEETDDPLVVPRRIESFNQKNLARSVIDEIDEKFQMRLSIELKEMKIQVSELENKNEKLNTEIKERKEQEFSRVQEQENTLNQLEKDKTKLKEEKKIKENEIGKLSKLLQGLKEKERLVKGLQEENSKLTIDCKQKEIKAFSQLEEKEKRVNDLLEENDKLEFSIKTKQDELEKMSKEVAIKADLTKKQTLRFEDKIRDLESRLKQSDRENNLHNFTGALTHSEHVNMMPQKVMPALEKYAQQSSESGDKLLEEMEINRKRDVWGSDDHWVSPEDLFSKDENEYMAEAAILKTETGQAKMSYNSKDSRTNDKVKDGSMAVKARAYGDQHDETTAVKAFAAAVKAKEQKRKK